MSDTDSDRIWSALDKTNQYIEGLEARLLRLETDKQAQAPLYRCTQPGCGIVSSQVQDGQLCINCRSWAEKTTRAPNPPRVDKLMVDIEPRPTRAMGDYLPDPNDPPLLSTEDKLTMIAGILREMLPPSGIPSPAQRLLIRIKAVVGE